MAVLLIITLLITLANTAFVVWLYLQMRSQSTEVTEQLKSVNLETQISDMFSHDLNEHDIHNLTFTLFKQVKAKFKIQANSYTEMAQVLKSRADIDEKLRSTLIDFFETITVISYRNRAVSDEDRQDIKKKLKLILKMLPQA